MSSSTTPTDSALIIFAVIGHYTGATLGLVSTIVVCVYTLTTSILSACIYPTRAIISFLGGTIGLPISLILYILSPAIALVQIMLDLFLWTPYAITLDVAQVFAPLYVLVGTAVIAGAAIGLGARGVAGAALEMLLFEPLKEVGGGAAPFIMPPVEEMPSIARMGAGTRRRRLKR